MTKGQESKHKRTYDINRTYGQMDNIYIDTSTYFEIMNKRVFEKSKTKI